MSGHACVRCGRPATRRYLVEMIGKKDGSSLTYPSYFCPKCEGNTFETDEYRFYLGRRIVPRPQACGECGRPMPRADVHFGKGGG